MNPRAARTTGQLLCISVLTLTQGCYYHEHSSSIPPHRVHRTIQHTRVVAAPPTAAASLAQPQTPPASPPAESVESVAVVTPAPTDPGLQDSGTIQLSPGVAEVVKLAQAQVDEDVILNFIANSPTAFNPTADELIYLADIGVTTTVVNALINKAPASAEVAAEYQEALRLRENAVQAEGPIATPPQGVVQTPNAGQSQPVVVEQQVIQPQQPVIQTETVVYEIAEPATYFQPVLAPYGSWVEVAPYGLCWQPTVAVVDNGWRPYANRGRWLHTDAGWYWQSDYSWGWAPFHYGRWHRHTSYGWVWTPGRTWGPAWVSWRRSSAYCGWAPLPPAARYRSGFGFSYLDSNVAINFDWGLSSLHYNYLPLRHFHSRHPRRHFVARNQVNYIHNETTVINHHHRGGERGFVNSGVPKDEIARLSRQEIRRVNIADRPASARSVVRPDRVVRNGDDLTIYRGGPRRSDAGAGGSSASLRNGANSPRGDRTGRAPLVRSSSQLSGNDEAKGSRSLPGSGSSRHGRSETGRNAALASSTAKRTLVNGLSRPAANGSSASLKQNRSDGAAASTRPTPTLPGKRPKPLPKGIAAFMSDGSSSSGGKSVAPRSAANSRSAPRPIISTPQNPKPPTRTLAAPRPVTSTPRPITSSASSPRVNQVGLSAPQPVTSAPNPITSIPKPLSPPAPVTSTPKPPAAPQPLTLVRSPGQPRQASPRAVATPSARVNPLSSSSLRSSSVSPRVPTPSPSRPTPTRTVVQRTPSASNSAGNRITGFQNPSSARFRTQSQSFNNLNQSGSRTQSSRITVAPSSSGRRTFTTAPTSRSAPRPTANRPAPTSRPSRITPQPRIQSSTAPPQRTVTPRSTPSRPAFTRPATRTVAPQARTTPPRTRTAPPSVPGASPSSRPRPN